MSEVEFDFSELTDYTKQLMKVAEEKAPKEIDKFMRREGSKLRTRTVAFAKATIQQKDGKYLAGIKRGKLYTYEGARAIRVYGAAPHTHLIEKGHRIVTKKGRDTGFRAQAFDIYEKVDEAFTQKFYKDCEDMIDTLLEEGL